MTNSIAVDAASPKGLPWLRLAVAVLLVLFVLTRLGAIYSESVNWDEFALLKNASQTASSGELHAGGRPGLAVLILLPLVSACADEIASAHTARLLWLAITGLLLLGLAKLASQMSKGLQRAERRADAVFAFALFALVPAFLEWSLQVRSDQLAIAAGLWGGVALIASRSKPQLAIVAGLLFGVGYLASQKLLYVGALVTLLALGRAFMDREWQWLREIARAVLGLSAMAAVLLAFPHALAWLFPAEATATTGALGTSFRDGVGAFEFYRQTIGYSAYLAFLPMLIPHALLAGMLCLLTVKARRARGDLLRRVGLAWAVLLLGLGVGLFHAAAFGYFFMVLGLFPAIAFALVREPLVALLPRDEMRRRLVVVAGCGALLLPALLQSLAMLQDTQSNQQDSLAFIARNFEKAEEGFHPEGALFCRLPESPFPIYFSQHIYAYFGRDEAIREQSTQQMMADFESRQVKFVLESWRLDQFPERLREFWYEHYQPYRGSVLVAGRYFAEQAEPVRSFDLLVDGVYRWIPLAQALPLAVDGVEVPPGGRVQLARGSHRTQDPVPGYLVLALNEPPGAAEEPFYRSD